MSLGKGGEGLTKKRTKIDIKINMSSQKVDVTKTFYVLCKILWCCASKDYFKHFLALVNDGITQSKIVFFKIK